MCEGQRQLHALAERMTALKHCSSVARHQGGRLSVNSAFGLERSIPPRTGGGIEWLRAGNQSGCQKANVTVTRSGENSTVFCIFV